MNEQTPLLRTSRQRLYGFLSRKHGLGAENILSSRIVLNSGEVVVANRKSHPDLSWALRGAGGGSFGVVTELTCQLHPAQGEISVAFYGSNVEILPSSYMHCIEKNQGALQVRYHPYRASGLFTEILCGTVQAFREIVFGWSSEGKI
jgi:FAD/FMN-containing dehydrogenase